MKKIRILKKVEAKDKMASRSIVLKLLRKSLKNYKKVYEELAK